MIGWYHQFSGHALREIPGDGEGQRGLERRSPRGCKELDTTWQLNSKRQGHQGLSLFPMTPRIASASSRHLVKCTRVVSVCVCVCACVCALSVCVCAQHFCVLGGREQG